jgi:tetratricopeptide (TPR) repeat protein
VTRHERPALVALPAVSVEDLLPPLDDQPGPAEPISSAAQSALVQSALAGTTPPPLLWTRRLFLLGGTSVALTGAAYLLNRRRGAQLARTTAPAPQPAAAAPAAAPPSPPTAPVAVHAEAPAPAATAEPAPAEVTEPSEERAAPSRKKVSGPHEVADLLHQANERRRQQRFPEALRLYQQILAGHPRSEEAYVAQVAAASLLHDRLHRPQAALKLFKRALRERPTGTLSEEAQLGLCEVQRALGDVAAEKAALQEFLARYGDSPARSRLTARLARLEGK